MVICKDPRLTYLNDRGYNVVRLPRKGIEPLGIIGSDNGTMTWLGTVNQVWNAGDNNPVPTAGPPNTVGSLNGQKTSDIKLSFGLEILANALSGMFGSTVPSLDVEYKNAKSLQFALKEVQSVGIDPFLIGNFLSNGDLRPNPFVSRYFTGKKNVEALIVTEVLQAKSIGVIGKRDAGTEVSVSVPNIQAMLGAKVSVGLVSSDKAEVVYEGQEYLVFGYKAFGIGMIEGNWNIYGIDAGADRAFALSDEGDPNENAVVERHRLVDISFNVRG